MSQGGVKGPVAATGGIAHVDEVGEFHAQAGEIDSRWRDLGTAAGSVTIGLNRIAVAPGRRATPVHQHGDEEEFHVVAEGSGLWWEDGRTWALAQGDAIFSAAQEGGAHTVIAGEEGITLLAFGTRGVANTTWLPHAGVMRIGPRWLPVDVEHPYLAEAQAGPLEVPAPERDRPGHIVAGGTLAVRAVRHGDVARDERDIGRALGSTRAGLRHFEVPAGMHATPPHCHGAEEEIFIVGTGGGSVLVGDEEHEVRPGTCVARPAGTGVAHCFRAGPDGLTLLAYGTREPNDITWYPRSQKVFLRGIGVVARLERVDFWDGEPG